MAEYYVIRDKNTGLYFRGKGVNRWGKHYNQASIYRVKGMAEHTVKEVSWRGEQAEIIPIQIIENTADVVPKSEVDRLNAVMKEMDEQSAYTINMLGESLEKAKREADKWHERCVDMHSVAEARSKYVREIFEEIERLTFSFGYGVRSDHTVAHTRSIDDDLFKELEKKYMGEKT